MDNINEKTKIEYVEADKWHKETLKRVNKQMSVEAKIWRNRIISECNLTLEIDGKYFRIFHSNDIGKVYRGTKFYTLTTDKEMATLFNKAGRKEMLNRIRILKKYNEFKLYDMDNIPKGAITGEFNKVYVHGVEKEDKSISITIVIQDVKHKVRKLQNKIIAVDFDGTLVKDCYPDIGPANLNLIRELKVLAESNTLILWTCRTGDKLNEAVRFCESYGLYFDYINENSKTILEKYGNIDSRKITADIYIDDKARKTL